MVPRRLIPWACSGLTHVGLAALLLSVGIVSIQTASEYESQVLGDSAQFAFEPAPIEAVLLPRASVVSNSSPDETGEFVAIAKIAMTQAHSASETASDRVVASTQRNRDELMTTTDRPVRSLGSPRNTVAIAGIRQTSAHRIVYLVDASGSMIGAYPTAVQEVLHSIARLSDEQQFAVVVFQAGEAFLAQSESLRRAGPTFGRQGIELLDGWLNDSITTGGKSDISKAIRVAVALRPDTIVIVSSGLMGAQTQPTDRDALLAMLENLNPRDARTGRRSIQIGCIHLMDPEPLGALEAIAREHGGRGSYRFVPRLVELNADGDSAEAEVPDETTAKLGRALELLKTGQVARARTELLRIGLGEPLHHSSPVALVSAAEISLLNDHDPASAVRLADSALRGARAFGLNSTATRAEGVLKAARETLPSSTNQP